MALSVFSGLTIGGKLISTQPFQTIALKRPKSLAILGMCGMFFSAAPANASVVLALDQFRSSGSTFFYDFEFTTAFDPGPPPASTDRLDNGTAGTIQAYATLYDIGGFLIAFSVSPNLRVSTQSAGITPGGVTPPDGPLTNVTLSYIGPSGVTVDTTYMGAVVLSSSNARTSLGYFTGQDTKNTGAGAGTESANIGRVAIPTTASPVPEPTSLSMLFGGGAVLLLGGFRLRKEYFLSS